MTVWSEIPPYGSYIMNNRYISTAFCIIDEKRAEFMAHCKANKITVCGGRNPEDSVVYIRGSMFKDYNPINDATLRSFMSDYPWNQALLCEIRYVRNQFKKIYAHRLSHSGCEPMNTLFEGNLWMFEVFCSEIVKEINR